nr:reverse transcriptase domain-containing protein [Tanacetum cinerariifolium]
MNKEHDQQAKIKATPKRLAYADSDKEAPTRSLARGFFDRFSLESSSTSDTYRQTRFANKNQRTLSKNKEPACQRRSRRMEDRSITKEKTKRKRSKSRGKNSGTKKQAWTSNTRKGVPPVLRISAFVHGIGHLELAKKINDKIPKMVDKMFKRVRAFIRGEVATGSAEMARPFQWDKGNVRPSWSGGSKKAKGRGG